VDGLDLPLEERLTGRDLVLSGSGSRRKHFKTLQMYVVAAQAMASMIMVSNLRADEARPCSSRPPRRLAHETSTARAGCPGQTMDTGPGGPALAVPGLRGLSRSNGGAEDSTTRAE
jgi:hypothetical protein